MSLSTEAAPRARSLAPFVPLAAGVLLALPTLVARFPPMTDLPLHAAVVGTLRHLHDASFFPPDLYRLNLGHPNQLFHLCAWALSYAMSVDWACKLVIAAAQIGILVAGGRLARHLGTSPWTALLLSPLALGWTYFWGLVANLVGFALLLFALPSLDRAAERPSARGVATSCGWMLLLYLAHESVMVVACSAVLVFTLGHVSRPLPLRATLARLAPVLFALVVTVVQLRVQTRMTGGDVAGASGVEWNGPLANLLDAPSTLTGALDVASRAALFLLALLGIGLFARERWQARRPERGAWWVRVHRYRFELIALGNALAYLLTPSGFAAGTMFNQRFFHPAYALFALTLAPQVSRRATALLPRVIAALVPVGLLLVDWPQFAAADRCARDLDALLPQITQDSAVVTVEADLSPSDLIFVPSTSSARLVAVRGGRLLFSLASSVISPVQYHREWEWNEATARIATNALNLLPSHDLTMFRHVLVHSRSAYLGSAMSRALAPEAKLVATRGEWTLLVSTLPVVALDSAEPPVLLGAPGFTPGDSLRARVLSVLKNDQAQTKGRTP